MTNLTDWRKYAFMVKTYYTEKKQQKILGISIATLDAARNNGLIFLM